MKTQPIKGYQWVLHGKKLRPQEWKTYCCGDQLKPCKECGLDMWKSLGDFDYGDWEEEQFQCQNCKNIIYVELPD